MPYLSIIIPAYNEEARLGRTLAATFDYLDAQGYTSEVIVVDDGSTDRTVEVAHSFNERATGRLRVLKNPGNQGKGYSVRNGMLNANGEIQLFYDADLSTPLSEIPKVIEPIANNQYDVVFGSRALSPEMIGEHQSIFRQIRGRIGNLIIRALIGINFMDTQCGFKAFKRQAAHSVFELQKITGFGFDPEILFIAQKQGWRLLEMPVHWNHVEGSKVTMFSATLNVLLEVVNIRWNDLTGKYNLREPLTAKFD